MSFAASCCPADQLVLQQSSEQAQTALAPAHLRRLSSGLRLKQGVKGVQLFCCPRLGSSCRSCGSNSYWLACRRPIRSRRRGRLARGCRLNGGERGGLHRHLCGSPCCTWHRHHRLLQRGAQRGQDVQLRGAIHHHSTGGPRRCTRPRRQGGGLGGDVQLGGTVCRRGRQHIVLSAHGYASGTHQAGMQACKQEVRNAAQRGRSCAPSCATRCGGCGRGGERMVGWISSSTAPPSPGCSSPGAASSTCAVPSTAPGAVAVSTKPPS